MCNFYFFKKLVHSCDVILSFNLCEWSKIFLELKQYGAMFQGLKMVFWTKIKRNHDELCFHLVCNLFFNINIRAIWESTFCNDFDLNPSMGFRNIKIPFMVVFHDDHNQKAKFSQELNKEDRMIILVKGFSQMHETYWSNSTIKG